MNWIGGLGYKKKVFVLVDEEIRSKSLIYSHSLTVLYN